MDDLSGTGGRSPSGGLFEDPGKTRPRTSSLVWIFLAVLAIYNGNLRAPRYFDPMPSTYLPFSILRRGDVSIDEFTHFKKTDHALLREDEILSRYPVLTPILAIPVYLIPVLAGLKESSPAVPYLGKFTASLYAALSCVAFHLLLRMLATRRTALILTFLYAFATSTWSVSSQALFQHAPSQLFLITALYFLVRGEEKGSLTRIAGLFLGLAVLVRYQNLLFAALLSLYVFHRRRREFLPFLLWALPTLVFFFGSNLLIYGSPIALSGGDWEFLGIRFSTPVLQGISGILFSPGRGLLVYSPLFIFSFAGLLKILVVRPPLLLFRYLAACIFAHLLLISLWGMWHGGSTWSYRLLLEITPLLCILLLPLWKTMEELVSLRILFALLVLASMLIQAVGVSTFRAGPNRDFWEWRNGRLNACFHAEPKLLCLFYDLGILDPSQSYTSCKGVLQKCIKGINALAGRVFRFLAPFPPPQKKKQGEPPSYGLSVRISPIVL